MKQAAHTGSLAQPMLGQRRQSGGAAGEAAVAPVHQQYSAEKSWQWAQARQVAWLSCNCLSGLLYRPCLSR